MLQVLAGYPHNGQERGEHVLNCMKAVVPILHEDLVDLWDAVIPKLLSYLTGTRIYNVHLRNWPRAVFQTIELVVHACMSGGEL